MFYHSLLSDWNHGNAHFLRGVASELVSRGADVRIYEPRGGWSLTNLLSEHGERPLEDFRRAYPNLDSTLYELESLDLDEALRGADLVIVHEWNEHELVRRVGAHRALAGEPYVLLFHDTHHRAVTDREGIAAYDLTKYDGVLAYGRVIRDLYLREGWARRAWVWHEAADTRVFYPRGEGGGMRDEKNSAYSSLIPPPSPLDLVWIGNWGDEERTRELHEFLIEPVRELGLKARVYGVRYPPEARAALERAGIEYAGWLPNFRVPEVFARCKVTAHVPRRPYVESLPGIPTIRPFEALACAVPLVSSPWDDAEHLFAPGEDFLVARDGSEMRRHLKRLLADEEFARGLAEHGWRTIRARHTCAHRVDELMNIYEEVAKENRRVVTA
jgi:spore maturation protein CgeB